MKLKKRAKGILISCISIPIVMTIVFAILRFFDHIPWDWVWVLAPIWTAAVITLLMIAGYVVWVIVMFFVVIHRGDRDL